MGLFAKKAAAATPSENTSIWFKPGLYPLVQIDQLKMVVSKKPGSEGAEKFVIVADILASNNAERPAGTSGVSQTLNSMHPGAADDLKRFVMALFPHVDPATIDEGAFTALTSSEQPAHGMLMRVEVYDKVSEKTGKTFTKHIWSPAGGEYVAQAAELRAKAGLPPIKK
jgi:hypothetical protein